MKCSAGIGKPSADGRGPIGWLLLPAFSQKQRDPVYQFARGRVFAFKQADNAGIGRNVFQGIVELQNRVRFLQDQLVGISGFEL